MVHIQIRFSRWTDTIWTRSQIRQTTVLPHRLTTQFVKRTERYHHTLNVIPVYNDSKSPRLKIILQGNYKDKYGSDHWFGRGLAILIPIIAFYPHYISITFLCSWTLRFGDFERCYTSVTPKSSTCWKSSRRLVNKTRSDTSPIYETILWCNQGNGIQWKQ